MSHSEAFAFPHRVAALRAQIASVADPSIDGLLVTHLENAKYLTGFTGSNALVLMTPEDALFLTDGRYELQAAQQVPGFTRIIVPQGTTMQQAAVEEAKRLGLRRVGFEAAHLTVRSFDALRGAAATAAAGAETPLEWVPLNNTVEAVRQFKDADELATMRRAIRLVDDCFQFIRDTVRVGMTERELAWEMEVFLRTRGAQRLSFDSIVGSGPNSALIHGRPTDRRIGESGGPEFLLLDFGAQVDGYCSDLTRTLVVGGAPTEQMRAQYDAVRAAQQAALDAIRPGAKGRDIDTLAREALADRGFPPFAHGLGHMLGRVCHDGMALSQLSDVTLAPGMVLTVEPGVYVEGFGGVRIEDDVLVTESGCEILTTAPKELLVAG
jgi:Xaa-Pro aminopeptidase